MADEANNSNDPNESGSEKTGDQPKDTKQSEAPTGSDAFDPSKLSDEDFEKIYGDERLYKHSRFKSLSDRAKKADSLEKAASEAEEKSLSENKKFEELANKYKSKNEELEGKIATMAIQNAIQAKAAALKIIDLEAATTLIDRSGITIKDGQVEGIDDALNKLVKNKPYLVSEDGPSKIGSPSNPSNTQTEQGTKRYKASQLQDPKFYQENEKDILEALRLGLIENDLEVK
jgi:hypothetical protein